MNYEDPEIAYIQTDSDGFRRLVAAVDISLGRTIVMLPQIALPAPDRLSVEVNGVHLDCTDSLAGAINHACDPSAAVRHGRIVAWKCIQAGEEITIDYQRTESVMAAPFKCECGHCEGKWIRGHAVHRMDECQD